MGALEVGSNSVKGENWSGRELREKTAGKRRWESRASGPEHGLVVPARIRVETRFKSPGSGTHRRDCSSGANSELHQMHMQCLGDAHTYFQDPFSPNTIQNYIFF